MTSIYAAAKMLARDGRSGPPTPHSELVEAVELEAERLYRLLEDFLAIIGAADSLRTVGEPVLIQHVLRGVIDDLASNLDSRRIHAVLPAGLPPARGDPDGLAHATRNVVERALEATPDSGVVEVVVRRSRTSVAVHVYDDGRPAGRRAFAPFEAAEAGGHSPRGRPLALAASRALIEAMGGRAWEARRPEGGTETGFALPLFRAEGRPVVAWRHPGRPRSSPGPRGRDRQRSATRSRRAPVPEAR